MTSFSASCQHQNIFFDNDKSSVIYYLIGDFKQLKQQRDKLKLYQRRIEQSLEKDKELARKLLRDGRKE
uniref:(California timema) hypothetical protein n=1 Tax=Timema californicum TaxID=61474 RepID=A0A7R9PE48_TIMCA|nr:unnamed protein product [Timema californicum]